MADEIIPNLFLGDLDDAKTFDGRIYCVMNAWPIGEPDHAVWIPVTRAPEIMYGGTVRAVPPDKIKAHVENLIVLAHLIHEDLIDSRVLVHCRAGRERSPFAIVWYLTHYPTRLAHKSYSRRVEYEWEDAYAFVKSKRSCVEDRTFWLPEAERAKLL